MKFTYLTVLMFLAFGFFTCQSQNNNPMQEQNNPLLCNPESGICEMPVGKTQTAENTIKSLQKPLKIIYYTDPICSSCWGIEPQLRKLKLEYDDVIEVEYRMGGLLPDWSYNSGGISKPSDVAHHWDEVSAYYDMPIDGDVWLEDPLNSSYPASIAFKAVQLQDNEKAILFLREIREMVFLHKRNIAKWEELERAAKAIGLDVVQFKKDCQGRAKELFDEDLKLGRELGVRGFPTLFFTDATGKKEMIYGSKPYYEFENVLIKLYPTAVKKQYDKSWDALFSKFPTLTAKEFSELSTNSRQESEQLLNHLTAEGNLEKHTTKNGSIWSLKKSNR